MADDKKNPEEYEYPPEEYYKGGEYTPPEESLEPLEPGGPALRASFLSRRVLLIVGFLLAIGIVYLVLSYTNARRAAELSQPTPNLTAAAAIPPTTTEIASPVAPQVIPNPTQDAAIAQVAQQTQVNQQTMADLQNQIQQLQGQLTQVTNSISALSNQIQVIANEIRAITIDRSLRGRGLGLTAQGTSYHLKALVPGRAWLQSRDGNSTSVTIGDRLPGYGIIQMINTQQGIVTTSSGAIIQYGQRDS